MNPNQNQAGEVNLAVIRGLALIHGHMVVDPILFGNRTPNIDPYEKELKGLLRLYPWYLPVNAEEKTFATSTEL